MNFTCYPSVDFIEVVIKLISFVGETKVVKIGILRRIVGDRWDRGS